MSIETLAINHRLITALTYSADANDFCRHLAYSILNRFNLRAAAILELGSYESVEPVGLFCDSDASERTWADAGSAWIQAIRENQPVFKANVGTEEAHLAIPLFQNGLVAGVLALIFGATGPTDLEQLQSESTSLKLAAEYYLHDPNQSSSRGSKALTRNNNTPESLTARQLVVLKWIQTGKTYASISREMHISESLVKQEAVRLFRFFGVDNRVSVLDKARSAGFLDAAANE